MPEGHGYGNEQRIQQISGERHRIKYFSIVFQSRFTNPERLPLQRHRAGKDVRLWLKRRHDHPQERRQKDEGENEEGRVGEDSFHSRHGNNGWKFHPAFKPPYLSVTASFESR